VWTWRKTPRRHAYPRASNNYDLVLLDIWMPDTDGVTLLKEWATAGQLTMPVIMMSGHATIETAVEATRIGALSFLEKPITCRSCSRQWSRAGAQHRQPGSESASRPALALRHRPCQHHSAAAGTICPARKGFDLDRPLREARDGFEKPISNSTWHAKAAP
jgi:DNA-binding NtrC family response regulator